MEFGKIHLNVGSKANAKSPVNYTGKDEQKRLDIIRKLYNSISDNHSKMELEDSSYETKYKYVIVRLKYAMDSYFKDLDDVTDDEIIETACDYLYGYLTGVYK